jgi:hypothetical protein
MEDINKLLVFFFLFHLIVVDNLKLNVIMANNVVNILSVYMLTILVNIELSNHLVRLNNLTHPPPIMFPQLIRFWEK